MNDAGKAPSGAMNFYASRSTLFATSSGPGDLPNLSELLILQNRKGQGALTPRPPAWDGSLRASPPVKGSRPIYPMETPNGVRSTVGGRFIPSGLLLAQDFTHEPACQTGERAPQGRFRHQPEQMVHPPFAWQLASFPSLPVCERRPRIAPCGTSPPYGHTPRKSRHGKPFLPSSPCIRN